MKKWIATAIDDTNEFHPVMLEVVEFDMKDEANDFLEILKSRFPHARLTTLRNANYATS